MNIPAKHDALLKFLIAQHLAEQIQQARMMGASHPQAPRARVHLEAARELALDAGVITEQAA